MAVAAAIEEAAQAATGQHMTPTAAAAIVTTR
jgi:hypothetical protein